MNLGELQARVDAWIGQFQEGYWPPLANLARLVEEVGELSRELNHRFGPKKKKAAEPEADLGLELADIVFVVAAIANSQGIDLEDAMARTLAKYEHRDKTRWLRKDGDAGPLREVPVRLRTADGVTLAGLFSDPPRGDGTTAASRSVVVCAHGMLSSKRSEKLADLAARLWSQGIACLRFDFRGCGDSSGDPARITYGERLRDLEAAVDFARRSGRERVALFGSSMGGALAILLAARDPAIRAVATLAAVSRPGERVSALGETALAQWRARGHVQQDGARIDAAYIDDALATDVLGAARSLAARRVPLLVLHGLRDAVVSPDDGRALAAEGAGELVTYADGDHRFTRKADLDDALERSVTHLRKGLTDEAGATAPE